MKRKKNKLIAGCAATVIPDTVEVIGKNAFIGCEDLKSIVIPNSVKEIEEDAFSGCTGLTNIDIPDSVTEAGGFNDCTELKSISIGKSITYIEYYEFSGCIALSNIKVSEKNEKYDSREDCNAIIETDLNWLRRGCASTVIPNSVTTISDGAFAGCTGLTSIVIPDSVTEIGDCAFSGCTGLTSIIIPDSVTEIGRCAFSDCTGLTSIIIPASVTKVEPNAFEGCTNLTSIKVVEGNKMYDSRENSNAIIETTSNKLIHGFASTIIPDSVTAIGGSAFRGCGMEEVRRHQTYGRKITILTIGGHLPESLHHLIGELPVEKKAKKK